MATSIQTSIVLLLKEAEQYLRAFSIKLTSDSNEADDLYQDTVLRILTNAEKFRPDTNFKAWAATVMRNTFINNVRKRSRQHYCEDETLAFLQVSRQKKMVSNEGMSQLEQGELMSLIHSLSDDFRVPFCMAHDGYKYEEISEKLNVPLGTIKSRIFFARRKLQAQYARDNREGRA